MNRFTKGLTIATVTMAAAIGVAYAQSTTPSDATPGTSGTPTQNPADRTTPSAGSLDAPKDATGSPSTMPSRTTTGTITPGTSTTPPSATDGSMNPGSLDSRTLGPSPRPANPDSTSPSSTSNSGSMDSSSMTNSDGSMRAPRSDRN